MKIGIDIDNTLAALAEGFSEYYKSKYGREIKMEEFEKYWLADVLGIPKEREYPLWKEYYDSNFFEEIGVMENAKKVINFLKEKNEIIFITARHLDWREKTLKFIKKHFPTDNFRIIFSGDVYGGLTKDKICEDLGISLIIEDHHEKSLDYANNGMKVILFERPWNRKVRHENITKISNWNEIPGILGAKA